MIAQVPVEVWVVIIFVSYVAGGAATVAYGSETGWFPDDATSTPDVPPRRVCQSAAFLFWPVFVVVWRGYVFGLWLAAPKPLPLPPEIQEKQP